VKHRHKETGIVGLADHGSYMARGSFVIIGEIVKMETFERDHILRRQFFGGTFAKMGIIGFEMVRANIQVVNRIRTMQVRCSILITSAFMINTLVILVVTHPQINHHHTSYPYQSSFYPSAVLLNSQI
jgi:hypothetical protein